MKILATMAGRYALLSRDLYSFQKTQGPKMKKARTA
jgi:hypothetical protein